MQTQTKNNLNITFDFSVLKEYKRQVFEVLNDSGFARLNEQLESSSVDILEKKIQVLLNDVAHIMQQDPQELMSTQKEQVIERLSHLQYYVFEDGFNKSIEAFLDMYTMSDVEDQVAAFNKLKFYFEALVLQIQKLLREHNYSNFIARINSFL